MELRLSKRMAQAELGAAARHGDVPRDVPAKSISEYPASVERFGAGAALTRIDSRDGCALNPVSDTLSVPSYRIDAKLVPGLRPLAVDR